MGYTFQDQDVIQPVSFLNELRSLTVVTTTPASTTVTSAIPISGSAEVTSRLLFNSSSPVPSEALVLSAVNTLLKSREPQLNQSVKIVNVTYEKLSDISYAIIFTFDLPNISISEDPVLKNKSYNQVESNVNNALNTLLNEPTSAPLQPKSANFTSTSNHIAGIMGYIFQDQDVIQPVSFLNELRSLTGFSDNYTGQYYSDFCNPNVRSGSAVVTSRLLFNSSSPVPSEALVLSAVNTLLKSREPQLNQSVKIVNVTYEKLSDTSYAIIFTFDLPNISISEDPVLKNKSYNQVESNVNNALNTLLNEPTSAPLQPKSANFTSTSNHIAGIMGYTFQDQDVIQPVSFLNELRSLTGFSDNYTGQYYGDFCNPNVRSGSAVVTSRLLFNSSSPVPSEALVLSAVNTLLKSREPQLNQSVKIVNVTYEKLSDISYAIIFTFDLPNISISEDPVLKNKSYNQVESNVNNALNTLLNEPTSAPLQPKSANFTSTSNHIAGIMGYTFQDQDVIQPVSFLNELRSLTVVTTTPASTTVTSAIPISGSAVVTSKLLFDSSSPVPSEALVLSAVNTLLNSREPQLDQSVKIVNVTYEKLSDTSYAIIFTFDLPNISIPEDPVLKNKSYNQVESNVNNALNTLLNEPTSAPLQPKSADFTSTANQIVGIMGYTFQDQDVIQPVSFLNELRSLTVVTTTPASTTVTSAIPISGSAVVISRLLFDSSSPVPSEALVLNAVNSLLNSRESQLDQSVKIVNVTYEKLSDTSYAIIFTFDLPNISIPEDPVLKNKSYDQVENNVNNALNTLLNEPTSAPLQPKSSNFISTSNQVDGIVEYTFQDKDVIQPVSFLNELTLQTVLTTTSSLPLTTTTPPTLLGKVLIYIRLVFVTLGPLPDPANILKVANSLLDSSLSTKQASRAQSLSDPVSFVNVTFTKINDTAYGLNFGFEISNVSMSQNVQFRNGTYLVVQNSINGLLNKILSNNSAPVINFQPADFTGNSTVIQANVEYVFSERDVTQPNIFVQQLLQINAESSLTTTALPPTTTTPSMTSLTTTIKSVIINIRLEFITLGPVPSESDVLQLVKSVLASNLTTTSRLATTVKDPVILDNVIYSKINDTAYALLFTFKISQVPVTETQTAAVYKEIQDKINGLITQILQSPTSFVLVPATFTDVLPTVIEANVTYLFTPQDSNGSAGVLVSSLYLPFPTPTPTIFYTTAADNSTNAAWVVAIIVPCAIVIMLVPCWILLCCLLCGCCAAIRRRWHRRRSYNVQYTTRNSLF
ncbi:uncharacterized protein LOC130226982 [Danio aesculapii]|uniref:uncharacterized protein LOC130226982 n=1 Tax=Danio aesculapii TaxID=1142201 RepID=UPI0024C0CAF8|nr:uncharacterized protein LOC130226982 [Danio aesculapii]